MYPCIKLESLYRKFVKKKKKKMQGKNTGKIYVKILVS